MKQGTKLSVHVTDREELSRRASRPNSSSPRPFLRWAGSKRLVLSHLVDVVPERYGTYYEPFLGSGALFFLLRPRRAVLGDLCEELVATFAAVRDNPQLVAAYVSAMRPSRRTFYRFRKGLSAGRFKRAAQFIYLNKTCWNGLYRVNSQGEFNVPYGWPKSESIADPSNLVACSEALAARRVNLRLADFEATLSAAKPGDLVFLDPPYVTSHSNNGFVDYNETLFSWADQVRLAAVASRLANSGVHVIVCNANNRRVRMLYRDFSARRYSRHSTLASDKGSRGVVSELLLYTNR